MRYRDAAAFRQALEQRLKSRAAGDEAGLARDRKRIVFQRLLARLSAVVPGRWLLKGGFALDLRLAGRARSTKDVDIEWRANEEELLDALIEAAEHDAGDLKPVLTISLGSILDLCLAATFAHGIRGWLTCTTASPTRNTSPTHTSVSVAPSTVKFSPMAPGRRSSPSRSFQ